MWPDIAPRQFAEETSLLFWFCHQQIFVQRLLLWRRTQAFFFDGHQRFEHDCVGHAREEFEQIFFGDAGTNQSTEYASRVITNGWPTVTRIYSSEPWPLLPASVLAAFR